MQDGKSKLQRAKQTSQHRLAGKQGKNEDLTHTLVTIAPDGGWAWVILMVSTWDCLCIDGVSLGYSVIQEDAIEHLKINGVQSSLMVSIFNCLVYLNGPVTAALANRFGFKILNVIGGAVGAIALATCYWTMTFVGTLSCYGIITGIGGAMIYMVSMACPGYWFEAKRSLAFGVSNSASGISALIIPPIARQIRTLVGWRYVFIFLGFMFVVAFLFGFLIKKPPMILVEHEEVISSQGKFDQTTSMSIINVRKGGISRGVDEKIRQMSQHANLHMQKQPEVFKRKLSDPSLIISTNKWSKFRSKWCSCCKSDDDEMTVERPLYKSDIFLHSRTDALAKKANMTQTDFTLSMHKMTTQRDIMQQIDKECVCCPEAVVRPLKEMLGVSLLKNVVYLFLLFDTMIYFSAIYVTYLFVPRTSKRKGLSDGMSILALQLFGAFVALARVLLGLVFHFFPNMPPHYFTGVNVLVGGIFHISLSFTVSPVKTCVLASLTGFFIGFWIPMRSVLVVRYLGLEKLTNAMGMLFVFQAIGSLYGAPLAEALCVAFNEDYMTYYFAGSMYAIAGILILPLELINNLANK